MGASMKAIAAVLALAAGCATMGADRTAQHWKRRGKVKEAAQTQDVRLSVAHGVNADGNAQIIPITDASNMVMVRDGTALTPREGLEIRKHYNLTSGYGAGTMVILKESSPPDVDLGNMFLQIDPSNGLQTVTDIEFMRDRTQLEGDAIVSVVYWDISAAAGSDLDFVTTDSATLNASGTPTDYAIGVIMRSGDLSKEAGALVYTVDGTALAGTNFTAISGDSAVVQPNATVGQLVTLRDVVNAGATNLTMAIEFRLTSAHTGVSLGTPSRINITITP
jgi:hypothetical protein